MRIFSKFLVGALLASLSWTANGVTFKIATLSPDGSPWMKLLRGAGDEITERSESRVAFKFYPGGVMGDDKTVLRKIRLGQLHGAVLTAGGLTQTYTDIQLYNLPMVFTSLGELDYVRTHMDPLLLEGLEAKGYVAFGIAEVGFAYAMSKAAVETVKEARAQKVWTPSGDPGSARAVAAFGIKPISLSIADVYSGLQTGLINGVAVPPVGAIALQWHTQLDHVLDVPLLYVYGLLTVSERQFKKLSEADQLLVREVMGDVVRQVNARSRKDHERAITALKAQGLVWHRPDAQVIQEWQTYAEQAIVKLVDEGFVSRPMYESLLRHLTDYRATLD
ncbi:MAG: C4-dicarboxylate ABC transporter [Gammaproteobacteria bacterium]|nr:MAG: C4-dicarboxylate ABC transporter [Gammaproteobacteria bacterium]TDJ31548.1 MAG: C4-dicarboxylate ABC transporter [Gammaproteobacteria bacterium]